MRLTIIGAYSPTNNRVVGAKLVDESGLDYTYLRMTWLYNQEGNRAYKLIPLIKERKSCAKQLPNISWTYCKIQVVTWVWALESWTRK